MGRFIEWLQDTFGGFRTKLTVETQILFDSDRERFIVGYGHLEGQVRNVGVGETASEAFKDLATVVDRASKQDRRKVRKKLSEGEDIPLDITVYHSDDYIVSVSNGEEVVEGEGRNMSSAFRDLSEKIVIDGL